MFLLRNRLVHPLLLGCALGAPFWAGCASGPTRAQERAAYDQEMAQARQRHEAELARLSKERDRALDEVEARGRELDRLTRDLEASRGTAGAHKESLDAALALLARKNQELKERQGEADTPRTAAEAVPLLLAKDRQIKALQAELTRLRAGEPKPDAGAPPVDGIVTSANLELDVPVARVDGDPISRREFIEFLYRDLGAPELLDLFVNRYLVVREARRRKIEIAPVDLELWVTKRILLHTRQAGGEEKMEETLREKGFTRPAWEARLRYQAEPALMLKRMVELNRRTPEGQEAFVKRVRAAYDDRFTQRVIARHVVVACREDASPATEHAANKKAQAAKNQLESGVAFEKVARYYSDDKESRKAGGILGTFDRHRYEVLPRLNSAFFTLPVGQIHGPIRSRVGFHVIKVEKRLPPEKPFDERTRRELIAKLEREDPAREEIDALVRKLRSRAKIETALVFD